MSGDHDSVRSSLQHVSLLARKRAQLLTAQVDAEHQFLHRTAAEYSAGLITFSELRAFCLAYRDVAAPGFPKRWDAAMPVSYMRVKTACLPHDRAPNEPGGGWSGTWPIEPGGPVPPDGVSVVYVLFDDLTVPCYLGSSQRLRGRLGDHTRAGKRFTRWNAYPHEDRSGAYRAEADALGERAPYLNRTGRH